MWKIVYLGFFQLLWFFSFIFLWIGIVILCFTVIGQILFTLSALYMTFFKFQFSLTLFLSSLQFYAIQMSEAYMENKFSTALTDAAKVGILHEKRILYAKGDRTYSGKLTSGCCMWRYFLISHSITVVSIEIVVI